jgi:hypothetical protein
MSVQSGGALGTSVIFFGAKIRFFPTGCGKPRKPMRGKTFLLGQIHKTVMGFGHPFAIMKNLNG